MRSRRLFSGRYSYHVGAFLLGLVGIAAIWVAVVLIWPFIVVSLAYAAWALGYMVRMMLGKPERDEYLGREEWP